jgi:hypothetical protein
MHRSCRPTPRIELDFAERCLVAGNVLLQKSEQRFGLLRAQIDALKIPDLHLRLALLLHRAESQEKIPDVHAHLHAVGIALAVVGRIHQFHIRLGGKAHKLEV